MKRLLVFIAFLLCTMGLALCPAFAEEPTFDFNRAFNDYIYTYGQYRLAYNEYVSARQAYLNYKTLTSETEALNKTLKMLQFRDEVVKTYLTALRLKLAETTGISNYDQNVLYLKLDAEVAWYLKHRNTLTSAGNLQDLLDSSRETQEKYQGTEILIYQTLEAILSGRETALHQRLNEQIEALKGKISEIRQKGDKKPTTAERWLLEAENRLARSKEKQNAARQVLAKLKPYDKDKNQSYNQAQFSLEESHQYLKETNSYLKEVIREIKSAD